MSCCGVFSINLAFTSDCTPGIRRRRHGRHFSFYYPDGRKVTDAAQVARIRRLAIPPAYKDVWICTDAQGHLQATGRDARGRKQYRYHSDWRTHRDAAKFDRMLEFGRSLPRIRRRVARDLRLTGLPRERVLATLVRLLETTLVRVGNEEYARTNGSFGLTTLRDRHVEVKGDTLTFEFRGKSGVAQCVSVSDPAIARIVRRCVDIPGQELFQWVDAEGQRHPVGSADVNDYLREASAGAFTAKDFRTWFATVQALEWLRRRPLGNKGQVKKEVVAAIAAVAQRLGNTPAISRKCYIHPAVLTAFEQGKLASLTGRTTATMLRGLLRRSERAPTLKQALQKSVRQARRRARSGSPGTGRRLSAGARRGSQRPGQRTPTLQ